MIYRKEIWKKTLAGCFGGDLNYGFRFLNGLLKTSNMIKNKFSITASVTTVEWSLANTKFRWAFKERKRTKIRKVLMGF
ncbi:unnamed protein product [Rhizophagus irregularis]|nr:unnamed protein product [Rhizophagus irregularis]